MEENKIILAVGNYGDFKKETEKMWGLDAHVKQGIAIIVIEGYLDTDSWYDSANPIALKDIIEVAKNDPEINGVCLVLNTNGGSVGGIVPLANAIKDIGKPTMAYCFNAHSGGYWIASQCDAIYCPEEIVEIVGSIGVYMIHFDYSEQLKNEGIKPTIIRSTGSPQKNILNSIEPLTVEAKEMLTMKIDEVYDLFVKAIKTKRNVKEEALRGASFNSKEALKLKLIDGIMTFEDAFKKLYSLI